MLASVYGFQAVYANVIGVFTNTVPVDAYRGAGRPEANYLVERLIDAAARELGIDRVELRRRNMVPPSAMPHTTPVGKTYDSGDFVRVLDAALTKMDWQGFERAAARSRRRAASGAGSGCPTISRQPAATRPSAPKSASPTTGSWTSMSARNPPARAMRRPMCS